VPSKYSAACDGHGSLTQSATVLHLSKSSLSDEAFKYDKSKLQRNKPGTISRVDRKEISAHPCIQFVPIFFKILSPGKADAKSSTQRNCDWKVQRDL